MKAEELEEIRKRHEDVEAHPHARFWKDRATFTAQEAHQDRAALLACVGGMSLRDAKWLPIESAPKDGTIIHAYWHPDHQDIGYFDANGAWYDAMDRRNKDKAGAWFIPTHWQPLPKPPSEASESPRGDGI